MTNTFVLLHAVRDTRDREIELKFRIKYFLKPQQKIYMKNQLGVNYKKM
jgi:hypothetical protein